MSELSVNHLLGIKNITKNDIDLIFETADHFKEVINRPIKKVPSLRDITIANIFFENSTRTKLSFELAQKRLSADVISFSAAQSSVKKGETLIDRRFSRDLPIQPDYRGRQVDAINNEKVKVCWKEQDGEDTVYLVPTINKQPTL